MSKSVIVLDNQSYKNEVKSSVLKIQNAKAESFKVRLFHTYIIYFQNLVIVYLIKSHVFFCYFSHKLERGTVGKRCTVSISLSVVA